MEGAKGNWKIELMFFWQSFWKNNYVQKMYEIKISIAVGRSRQLL